MVQNPTGTAITKINKPSAHESILPHCHHRGTQEPGLGESKAHYPDGFCDIASIG